MTFTRYASLTPPRVIANTSPATVVAGSNRTSTVDPGNATHERRYETSLLVEIDDGTAVVGIADPQAVVPYKNRTASVAGGTLSGTDRVGNTTRLSIDADGVADVAVEYTGYRAGDANLDGTVSGADARSVARAIANDTSTNQYGDVDGDGRVDAVDAMFVAQYRDGNRTADYEVS